MSIVPFAVGVIALFKIAVIGWMVTGMLLPVELR
jgi:hypothetical protein